MQQNRRCVRILDTRTHARYPELSAMTDRTRFLSFAAAAFVAALLVAGCASTTLQSTWMDPGFTGGPFKKFFVVGLSARDVTTRRVFEDIVVTKLQAAGVQAIPAWQSFRDEGQASEAQMEAAVVQSGADALGHADPWPLNDVRAVYAEMLGLGRRRSETLDTLKQVDAVTAATADYLREKRLKIWRACGAALGLAFTVKEVMDLVQFFAVPNAFEWQIALIKNMESIDWLNDQALRLHLWHMTTLIASAISAVLGGWVSYRWDAKLESK